MIAALPDAHLKAGDYMARSVLGLVIIVIALIGLFSGAGIWTDYMWFASLAYQDVFWTLFLTRFTTGLVTFGIFFLFFWLNLVYLRRYLPRRPLRIAQAQVIEMEEDPFRRLLHRRAGTWLLIGFSALLALILAAQAGSQWEMIQKFLHAASFQQTDPVFGRDISFYVFELPFYELLRSLLTTAFILALVFVGLGYLFLAAGEFLDGGWRVFSPVKLHLALLAAGLLLIKAWDYRLQAYGLLLSSRGAVFGAGYTDMHARLPVLNILMVLAAVAAVAVFIGIWRGRLRPIGLGIGVLIAAAILLGGIYPGLIQKFQVEPNEFSQEQPYLEYHMAATRAAYNLEEVRYNSFVPQTNVVDQAVLEEYRDTLSNLRLWDYRPLAQVYNQLQHLRRYYRFVDVDIDRYMIDGEYRQVMLSVRELDQNNLSEQAQSWVNRRLQYTHGYGVVMSPVNEADARNLPVFLIHDIPPQAEAPELTITRPEIYFGELTNNIVVVNTASGEFDYPAGDENVYTSYAGQGGVQLSNWWRRLAYAVHFQDLRLLLNTDITPESRILYYRTVQDAQRLAPYLTYDGDPYPVIAGGRVYWIWDAYTTTDHYPYAQPAGNLNYIRNAVKIVVDAYTGEISFYISDPTDPLVQTYSRIFPDLYRPLAEMPAELRSHLRYPVDLFQVQATINAVYHMQDPRVFYNREDEWAIPSERYAATSQTIEPYYTMMQLPGELDAEFVLTLPFTPVGRDNLVAWMAARSDGDHYGEMVIYEFPKEAHVFGPMQVEASIDQDAEISQQLTLWSQRGSEVIRGNLITVPLAGSLLYVEPLFLQAEQSSLPELTRIIVSYQGRVVMEKDLQTALTQLFAREEAPPSPAASPPSPAAPLPEGPEGMEELARQANELYFQAQESLRSGDWTGYGKALDALGDVLQRMVGESDSGG